MKKLTILLLTFSLNAYAGAPLGVQGQASGSSYPPVIKVPNSQATVVTGGTLIETGNGNILVDAEMESTLTSAWTCTSGTCSKTSTAGEFSSGKQALKMALSAQALNVSQSVATVTGSMLQYVVGLQYKVPSAVTDFQICTLIAGAEKTCVPSANLIADGLYHSIEIPEVITAGSTVGVKVKTTATYTQNIFIDNAYIKQGLGTQALQLDNVYSAKVSGSNVITDQNKTWLTTCSAYTCNFVAGVFSSTPNCSAINALGTARVMTIVSTSTSSVVVRNQISTSGSDSASEPFILSCQKSGNDYLASSAAVYSQASANYGWTAYTPTFTNVTGVTSTFYHMRLGGNLYIKGTITAATCSGAVVPKISLPSGLTADSSVFTTSELVGMISSNGSASSGVSSMAGMQILSSDLVNLQPTNIGNGSATFPLGSPATCAAMGGWGAPIGVQVGPIPISGWSNATTIVGSFEKIEKCASVDECTDIYTLYATSTGANVTLASTNVPNWATISYTSLGIKHVTFKSGLFTTTPSCQAQADGTTVPTTVTSITTSGLNIITRQLDGTFYDSSTQIMLTCGKQGVDSKPKTAKIASSIGVPTVPGIVGTEVGDRVDTFSVSYGATATTACTATNTLCAYNDQIGSDGGTVTHGASAGLYILNTTKTYTKLKCLFQNASNSISVRLGGISQCATCSALPFDTVTLAAASSDSVGTLMCQGTY